MPPNKIDITAESSPWQAKLIGIMFLAGALAAMNTWWLSVIFVVAGLALLTWYSGTVIDPASKTFREYTSCLFIRKGATEKFSGIERVFINQSKVSQKMHTAHTSSGSTFHYVLYNAYLKFDDGKKIFLTSRKNKAALIELLKPVVAVLAVELVDNTVPAESHS